MKKDDLLHLFDSEMSQEAEGGHLSVQRDDTVTALQANSLDRMQKGLPWF